MLSLVKLEIHHSVFVSSLCKLIRQSFTLVCTSAYRFPYHHKTELNVYSPLEDVLNELVILKCKRQNYLQNMNV